MVTALPGPELAALLGVPDHRRADAALHRVGRVAPLDLGEDGPQVPVVTRLMRTSGVLPMLWLLSSATRG
jgi:hypothetical protein